MSNRNNKLLKPVEIYLAVMSDLDTNCVTTETFTQVIADECLGNLILNAINTIRKNKNPPDAFSISEFMYEELKNPDLTIGIIE